MIYDARNRLVASKTGGTTNIAYAYDGAGHRISSTVSGTTTDYYFSDQWQVVEERVSGTARVQYVWSPTYVNEMVLRDRDSDSNGSLDERIYPTSDANHNITALINTSGTVLERFYYDPYGAKTVLNSSWSGTSDSYSFLHGFQDGKVDSITGRINFQHRDYDVTLAGWTQQDPMGYVDGLNSYQFVVSNPNSKNDPSGEETLADLEADSEWLAFEDSYNSRVQSLGGGIMAEVEQIVQANAAVESVYSVLEESIATHVSGMINLLVSLAISEAISEVNAIFSSKNPPPQTTNPYRKAGLPTRSGNFRFIPPENSNPNNPLKGPNKGYMDKFGQEWLKGPAHHFLGDPYEWDVQLPNGTHVDVSIDGVPAR